MSTKQAKTLLALLRSIKTELFVMADDNGGVWIGNRVVIWRHDPKKHVDTVGVFAGSNLDIVPMVADIDGAGIVRRVGVEPPTLATVLDQMPQPWCELHPVTIGSNTGRLVYECPGSDVEHMAIMTRVLGVDSTDGVTLVNRRIETLLMALFPSESMVQRVSGRWTPCGMVDANGRLCAVFMPVRFHAPDEEAFGGHVAIVQQELESIVGAVSR